MKPSITLATARTPAGVILTLQEHDGDYYLRLGGRQLMTTRETLSERALAEEACHGFKGRPSAQVLIGGLGLGFTLQRCLELLGQTGKVHVAELIPEVVAWNREHLRGVNGRELEDPRVTVFVRDVFALMKTPPNGKYDAILLDIDNGPTPMVADQNARLYYGPGFRYLHSALKDNGRAAFWSAEEDRPFVQRLIHSGFQVQTVEVKPHERARRASQRIYVAQKSRRSAGREDR